MVSLHVPARDFPAPPCRERGAAVSAAGPNLGISRVSAQQRDTIDIACVKPAAKPPSMATLAAEFRL
jgi:hypothetical protein